VISKEAKAEYDREYRRKNRALLKAKKAAYFQRTYDPVKAAKERKKKMSQHIEYCRQPWYKAYKREYDKQRRAGKFGDFKEAYALLLLLKKEIKRQQPDRFELYKQSGRHQWNPINQKRRRDARKWLDSFGL
jgi:hypothetical protein